MGATTQSIKTIDKDKLIIFSFFDKNLSYYSGLNKYQSHKLKFGIEAFTLIW